MEQQTFKQQLDNAEFSPVYYFYGEEKLLMERSIKEIKQKILPVGLEDFNFERYTSDKISPKQIAELAMNLPFMAEKRILVIDCAANFFTTAKSDKENQESMKSLLSYLEQPNPQCCLIFCGEKPLAKTGALNKALQAHAEMVEFAALKGKVLENWIRDYLEQQGRVIQRDAVEHLSALNSFDLEIMEKELEKLLLYTAGKGEITKQQVLNIVTKTVEANIFDLTDALGNRRGRDAIQVLRDMLVLGEPALKITATLVKHIQNLILVKDYRSQGWNDTQIKEKTKLHPYVIKKSTAQANRFTMQQLITALDLLLAAEVELKSTGRGAQEVLEQFILDVCY